MEINNFYSYNNYAPNFKQVSLVKIKKSAFANPNNLAECQFNFDSILKKISKTKISNKLIQYLTYLGLGRFATKFLLILENPLFLNVQDVLQKQNFGADLNWLQSNTQTELPEAMDPDAHSFYVLTGKDKNDYISELSIKKLFKFFNEFKEISAGKKFSDPDAAECYAVAKFSTFFNRKFNKSIEG